MDKYLCEPCGYVYDPEVGDPDNGIAPGTSFEDLPEDWVCPWCGLGKDVFVKEGAQPCLAMFFFSPDSGSGIRKKKETGPIKPLS